MEQKTALLTGITGFIGSHLAVRLINDGWKVHAIVRKTSNVEKVDEKCERKITFHMYDENNTLNEIVKQTKPYIVYHLASLYLSQHKQEEIPILIDSNIKFGTELVEAMVQNQVYKIINTGTSWQHYNNEEYNPVNLYAATKQAFECIIKYYKETTPLSVITLKLFDTYGPDDPRPKIMTLLNKLAQTGAEIAMSKGEQYIDLVYIDDVIEAYIKASQELLEMQEHQEKIYAVMSGKPIQLQELVRIYEQTISKKLNIKWGGREYRNREVMTPWNKGLPVNKWKAKIELQEGIKSI